MLSKIQQTLDPFFAMFQPQSETAMTLHFSTIEIKRWGKGSWCSQYCKKDFLKKYIVATIVLIP